MSISGLEEFGILQTFGARVRLQIKLAPRQYFSVSRAPYCAPCCTPYRKDFKFILLRISYDLMYLRLFLITYIFGSPDNIFSYV